MNQKSHNPHTLRKRLWRRGKRPALTTERRAMSLHEIFHQAAQSVGRDDINLQHVCD